MQPPPEDTLPEVMPPLSTSVIRDNQHHHHHQCPPHFVQTPFVDTVNKKTFFISFLFFIYVEISVNENLLQISCAPRCGADAYYRAEDKRFVVRWMTGWAWLCFISTLFTLLTFWVEPSRFRYPERPIVFLALCYNFVSILYIVRGAMGPESLSCAYQVDEPSYVPVSFIL